MEEQEQQHTNSESATNKQLAVSGMYENYFLDYASYVIMERAVPALIDGLKPVQRRILHAMKEMDDGRFHKVANIIGQTMQYHPHGDAAIGDALVNMGQKDLLIDTQGNWGDVRTGDPAAAARYIEARLSRFALEVAFNPQITEWQLSYDGRKKEPVLLPMKFPMVLAQGAEGIAVGLATKIMPHNFQELCKASIDVLKGKKTHILPDFPAGGQADFSQYNGGLRGGKIRLRADIEVADKKTLLIKSIPYGTTTTSLIDSIIKANEKGKIKIKKVVDNTAEHVEVQIELPSGVSPDLTVDALYAFTNCEQSISPNCCVIQDEKPQFLDVNDILQTSTEQTKAFLQQELEIRKGELQEKLFFNSLEKIFIENRIYRDIEECETWEAVIATIDKGLDPFKPQLLREVTEDDIVRLTEIKIKRISKFDSFKADEIMRKLQEDLAQVEHHLAHLTEYAIDYFQMLLDKFGKGKERKTLIKNFDTIEASQVVANNAKLYVNREEGFIGMGLKKDEFITDCSDIDDIIVFRKDGIMKVVRIDDKVFVGKDIIHVAVWQKGDERTIYNMIYRHGKTGVSYAKRFAVTSITRDKEYNLAGAVENSRVLYFAARPNGEAEWVTVYLSQSARARKKVFEYDFGDLDIKGRMSKGNTVTRYSVRKVEQKEVGASTIGGMHIWLDESTGRLNTDERGKYMGEFDTGDSILVVYKNGTYQQTNFDLVNRYEMEQILHIQQFDPEQVIAAVYLDGERQKYMIKRFKVETSSLDQKFPFITEHPKSKLILASLADKVAVSYVEVKGKAKDEVAHALQLEEFIDVKGWRAVGNQLGEKSGIKKIKLEAETFVANTSAPATDEGEDTLDEETATDEHISRGSTIEWEVDPKPKATKNTPKDPTDQGSLF